MPDPKINILILEDRESDYELMVLELRKTGRNLATEWAPDKDTFLRALKKHVPDLLLADYSLPGFNGMEAMSLARQLFSEMPAIIVSGIMGEEYAIEALKAGATDYVLKQRLYRLSYAVNRALLEAEQLAKRKLAEEQLVAEHDFVNAVLLTQGAPVLVFDRDARIVRFNPAGEQLTGYTSGEVTGRSIFDLFILPEERSEVEEVMKKLRSGVPLVENENHWLTKAGEKRFVRWRGAALLDEKGQMEFCVATGIDITDRLDAEKNIQRLNTELERRAGELAAANRDLESYSYSVSHDLRAPLRIMKGFSDILLEEYGGKLDDTGRDYLKRIESSADKMSRLIDDMLSLSRISQREIVHQDVDLSAIAHVIIGGFTETQPERRVHVVIHNDLRTRGDQRLLQIALTNLLGNAWKYTAKTPESRIEFGSTRLDNETVFFVRDNGVGLPMELSDKLFKPFHRLHPESEFPGTGIGLAIVERVIRRHGGRIWVESEVDKGAAFYFTLGPQRPIPS